MYIVLMQELNALKHRNKYFLQQSTYISLRHDKSISSHLYHGFMDFHLYAYFWICLTYVYEKTTPVDFKLVLYTD